MTFKIFLHKLLVVKIRNFRLTYHRADDGDLFNRNNAISISTKVGRCKYLGSHTEKLYQYFVDPSFAEMTVSKCFI